MKREVKQVVTTTTTLSPAEVAEVLCRWSKESEAKAFHVGGGHYEIVVETANMENTECTLPSV